VDIDTVAAWFADLAASMGQALAVAGAYVGSLLYNCLVTGLPVSTLITVNSIGTALFIGAIAIIGTGFPTTMRPQKSPTDFRESQLIYSVQYRVDGVIRGSIYFGAACLLSLILMVIDRQTVCVNGCESPVDPALNILASNITAAGLLWSVIYYLGRSLRFATVVSRS
jgi:hypothetical protein